MSTIFIERTVNLNGPIIPDTLTGVLNCGEVDSHEFTISATLDNEPFALSGVVTASFIRSDGVTVPLTGSISDGAAVVALSNLCYNVPGRFVFTVFITSEGVTTAIYGCTGTVRQTDSGSIVDPGEIIPSVSGLITAIENAIAEIPADYSQLLATQAQTFSTSKPYITGEYVWHDGTLYRFTAAHAAGSWTGSDAKAVTIGGELADLKSAFDVYGAANHAPVVNGTYRPGSFTVVADGLGDYTINGSSTGSGLTHYDIYNNANAFPSGFGAGDELFLVHDCANSNIIFRLYERVGSSYSEIANINGYGTKAVKLSANATGCIVRLSITNGTSYTNVVSKPIIMTTLTKQETDERLTENAYDVKHISPVDADNKYYYVKGYRFSGKTFISNTGIVDSNIRALCEITLNDGAIVYFDNSVYAGTYMIVDKATKKTLLVPNTGWNTTGEMVIDTNGVNNYVVLLQFKDKTNDSNNVDPANVDKRCYVIDRNRIVDLFLFAGQSNMAGRGVTNSTWPESYPSIIPSAGLEFRAITDKTRLYPMAEPFGKFENKTGGIDDGSSAPDGGNKTGGLAVAFVNEYYMRTGVPVIGISASEGGTGIQSWITGSENLTDALQRLSDAITYLTNNGYTIRHKFMLWCQGESDTRLGVTGDQYKTYFDDIMVTMKNAGIEKCFLIRIGEFNGTDYDYSDIINAQTDIAQDRDDTVMATTILTSYKSRGLMKDQYHYYQAAYNEIGRYTGINVAEYVNSGKEPTMYDPKNNDLYFCHKN